MIIALVLLAFWIWALVDAISTRQFRVGERWMWVLVILFGLLVGALVYTAVGRQWKTVGRDHPSREQRPAREPRPTPGPEARPAPRMHPKGPDDDPDFLASL